MLLAENQRGRSCLKITRIQISLLYKNIIHPIKVNDSKVGISCQILNYHFGASETYNIMFFYTFICVNYKVVRFGRNFSSIPKTKFFLKIIGQYMIQARILIRFIIFENNIVSFCSHRYFKWGSKWPQVIRLLDYSKSNLDTLNFYVLKASLAVIYLFVNEIRLFL